MLTYSWVEETTTDSEEYPGVDSQGEPEAQRNVEQRAGVTWRANDIWTARS
jgi:hypothetical protein